MPTELERVWFTTSLASAQKATSTTIPANIPKPPNSPPDSPTSVHEQHFHTAHQGWQQNEAGYMSDSDSDAFDAGPDVDPFIGEAYPSAFYAIRAPQTFGPGFGFDSGHRAPSPTPVPGPDRRAMRCARQRAQQTRLARRRAGKSSVDVVAEERSESTPYDSRSDVDYDYKYQVLVDDLMKGGGGVICAKCAEIRVETLNKTGVVRTGDECPHRLPSGYLQRRFQAAEQKFSAAMGGLSLL
ncbi:hypothetical protein LTR56_013124 [Elasticomyces elasticus]|nr:hypothetical protein LTR56_013124 [Elasticomyces elasticus]KAK3656700.1 hypothetical protein LTR22_009679 [Elasticomyces elasticus]KAK4921572.1 hypothetical protein LTR49_011042 [Elasticomyces elasticus]KAK5760260.1 hypothetical protein LTS12_009644 [Elasticomyces elasticus]